MQLRISWTISLLILCGLGVTGTKAEAAIFFHNGVGEYGFVIWDGDGSAAPSNNNCAVFPCAATPLVLDGQRPGHYSLRLSIRADATITLKRLRIVVSLPAGDPLDCTGISVVECGTLGNFAANLSGGGLWIRLGFPSLYPPPTESPQRLIFLDVLDAPSGHVASNGDVFRMHPSAYDFLQNLDPLLLAQARVGIETSFVNTLSPDFPFERSFSLETVIDPFMKIIAPTAEAHYRASSRFITLNGTASDLDGSIASVTWASDRGFSGIASIGSLPTDAEWFAHAVPLAPGVNTITVKARDNDGLEAVEVIDITVDELSYNLAEGATGGFFDLDLLLANPHAQPVDVTARFLKPAGGGTVVQIYTLPPQSRLTVDVGSIPGLEASEVSTVVTGPAEHPIVVERTMRWGEGGYGAHTEAASAGASSKWYFAEGAQGFFHTFLLLANPHGAANEATVTSYREDSTPVVRTYPLEAWQRYTVDTATEPELHRQSFGMEVTFAQPGIAERSMYFGDSPFWAGGHESAGVTERSREWFLAEGATGPFFETFVLFANPGTVPAAIHVRYLPTNGLLIEKDYTLAPQSRLTVNLEHEHSRMIDVPVATQVSSNVPILVERAQYWPDPASSWYEAHNSFGVTALGTKWGLAEGRVGGPDAYQTYILLANPDPLPATVTIQFLRESGAPITKQFTVQPSSRFNVAVGTADVPEITEGAFGALITASRPIAVERAMYANANGQVWQAGTNATATRLP